MGFEDHEGFTVENEQKICVFLFTRGLAVRRLPRMQEVVGSNPTEGKICFSHFTLLECNVKKCFVKQIKTLKINRKKIISSVMTTFYSYLLNNTSKKYSFIKYCLNNI